jgi:hypothetical protein
MIKIQIKSVFGKIIFEYEKEENSIKETLIEAVKNKSDLRGADLRGADLRGVDLRGVDLRGADLQGTDLQGVDLRGADLRGADLRGVDLRGVDLRGADLQGADLQGADLRGIDLQGALYGDIKISKSQVFTGLYKYVAIPIIAEDGKKYIRLGCFCRLVSEWKKDFWNNDNEFPNNGSIESESRKLAFKTCLEWLRINSK